MKNKLIIAGYLSKSDWGGKVQPREQDFIVDEIGCCMSIPATYTRHPFKILTHVEDNGAWLCMEEPTERSGI